jgi:hypothetical protein
MGMFDYLKSSYDLGPDFTNRELYTKDIEEGIGGTMSQYWVSPSGCLYYVDYSHTADFVELKEGDDGYDNKHLWANFRWIPNGNRGKVTPWLITKYIEVYPPEWDGQWKDWPRLKIHLKYGIIQDYEDITGQR